jgi:hypothetical protein
MKMTARKPRKPRECVGPQHKSLLTDAQDTVTGKVTAMLTAKHSPIDIDEIALEFYMLVGGAKGFVAILNNAYKASHVGSSEQARLIDIMTDLFKLASSRRSAREDDQVSDADLEALAHTLMGQSGISGMPMSDWITHVCI